MIPSVLKYAVAGIGFTALTTSAIAQENRSDDSEAQAAILAAYAELLGTDERAARTYQSRVTEVNGLAEQIRQDRPEDYAGMRILPGSTFQAEIYLVGDAEVILAQYTQDGDVSAQTASRSLTAVEDALGDVLETLQATSTPFTAYVDETSQEVVVALPNPSAIEALIAPLQATLPVRIVAEDRIVYPTAMIDGGMDVDANGQVCTSGVVVNHSDGREGVTTAGHCENNSVRFEGTTIPFVDELYRDSPSYDLQWHSDTTNTYTPYVQITGSGYLAIDAVGSLSAGSPVCFNGATSGMHCGRVEYTNNSGTDSNGVRFQNAVSFRRDDNTTVVRSGDSGAPMITSPDGVGTVHGFEFAGFDASGPDRYRGGMYLKYTELGRMGLSVKIY